jgi:hypothetical protein
VVAVAVAVAVAEVIEAGITGVGAGKNAETLRRSLRLLLSLCVCGLVKKEKGDGSAECRCRASYEAGVPLTDSHGLAHEVEKRHAHTQRGSSGQRKTKLTASALLVIFSDREREMDGCDGFFDGWNRIR